MFRRLHAKFDSLSTLVAKGLGVLIGKIEKMDQNVQELTVAWQAAKKEIEASRVLLQKIPGLIAAAATQPDVGAALKDLTAQIVSETAALTTDVDAASPAPAPVTPATTPSAGTDTGAAGTTPADPQV